MVIKGRHDRILPPETAPDYPGWPLEGDYVNTRLFSRLIVAGALCALTGFAGSAYAALATFGPTPYLSSADSPFASGASATFTSRTSKITCSIHPESAGVLAASPV